MAQATSSPRVHTLTHAPYRLKAQLTSPFRPCCYEKRFHFCFVLANTIGNMNKTQANSTQDTNSCCCAAAGYMGECLTPYACDSEGKARRQNSANYGIHHTRPLSPKALWGSSISNMFAGTPRMTLRFFFLESNHFHSPLHIPQLSYDFSMWASVYRGTTVGTFYVLVYTMVKPVRTYFWPKAGHSWYFFVSLQSFFISPLTTEALDAHPPRN